MATQMIIPEELDVFREPHLRMKQLVNCYNSWVDDVQNMGPEDFLSVLRSLRAIFIEFRSHEHIEDKLIIGRLLEKMKQSCDGKSSIICDCHKDNRVTEMIRLFAEGVTAQTAEERISYGLKLSQQLQKFTETFLPHMKEEEEIFQPLLLQYFNYEELRRLKDEVIKLHSFDKTKIPISPQTISSKASSSLTPMLIKSSPTQLDFTSDSLARRAATLRKLSSGSSNEEIKPSGVVTQTKPTDVAAQRRVLIDPEDSASCISCRISCSSRTTKPSGVVTQSKPTDVAAQRRVLIDPEDSVSCISCRISCSSRTTDNFCLPDCLTSTSKSLPQSMNTLQSTHSVKSTKKNSNRSSAGEQSCSDLSVQPDIDEKIKDASYTKKPEVTSNSMQLNEGKSLKDLPEEIILEIFQYLTVKDLCRCSQVCSAWATLTRDVALWRNIMPTIWAKGYWTRSKEAHELISLASNEIRRNQTEEEMYQHEMEQSEKLLDMCNSLIEHILPNVGSGVQTLILSNSPAVTADLVQRFLMHCPNLTHLDLSMTDITDQAFSRMAAQGGQKEEKESSCHCNKVLHRLHVLNLSGCANLTDASIEFLFPDGMVTGLISVNLSGCLGVSSRGLWRLARSSPHLDPSRLYYCDNIIDGPFPNDANGCANLEMSSCNEQHKYVCCRSGH